jgi:hypothetical protein
LNAFARRVLPEILDSLSPQDPRAQRSRRDLRTLHRAMGSVSILTRALSILTLATPSRRIIELGAGDGTLLLRLARALRPRWTGVQLTLLDRHDLVTAETRNAYQALDWSVTVLRDDALTWARAVSAERYDLCVTTLFLHHFAMAELDGLLCGIAAQTNAFVAIEPRRGTLSRLGSRGVFLIGANDVTREDAVKSVAAGFRERELTAAWRLVPGEWIVDEHRALPFTHVFTAVRASARREPR